MLRIKFKKKNNYHQELEADGQINSKNFTMENDHLKTKIKNLEDTLSRYKEEDDTRNKKAQAMFKEVFKPSQVLTNL